MKPTSGTRLPGSTSRWSSESTHKKATSSTTSDAFACSPQKTAWPPWYGSRGMRFASKGALGDHQPPHPSQPHPFFLPGLPSA
jgi:hypothetical protein